MDLLDVLIVNQGELAADRRAGAPSSCAACRCLA
jgi:hypothetical protein